MKFKLTVGLVVLVVAATVVFYLVNRPSSGGITYPFPNGYDAINEAGEKMTPLPMDFDTTQDIAALQAYVDANADPLALLDQAVDQEYLIRVAEMQSMQELLDRSALARNASRLMYVKARLAELEGRSIEAADALLAISLLGRRSANGGLMIHQLMAIAIERQGVEGLMQLAPKLSKDEKTQLADLLEAEDQNENEIDAKITSIALREREMTKREYGTFAGSYMLWQLADSELLEQQFDDLKAKMLEMRAMRQELIDLLRQQPPAK